MVSSSEDIIRRAKQMDLEVRYGSNKTEDRIDMLMKYIQVLENKINILMNKVDDLSHKNSGPLNSTHERMMNMLWEWRSTSDLASLLGYSQEHVSRMMSDMKKRGTVQERREGKKRLYKRIE